MNEDTAVVVTAYCDGQNPEEKRKMAKTLVKSLKEKGHYVCMTTHSILDEETQSYCDAYLYDRNNPWQINGQPTRPKHAVAELILMHTANDFVQKYGFKNVFKMTFDLSPNLDVHEIINRSKSKNKNEDQRVKEIRKIGKRFVMGCINQEQVSPSFKEGLRVQLLIKKIKSYN
jgi:hypothetical protein